MKSISVLLSVAIIASFVFAGVKKSTRKVHSDDLVAYGNSFLAERHTVKGSLVQELMLDCFTAVAKQGDDDDDDESAQFVHEANENGFRMCTTFELLAIAQNHGARHFPEGCVTFVAFAS